jgi:PAS domain-containing protein
VSAHELALLLAVSGGVAVAALALEPIARSLGVPTPLAFLLGGLLLGEVWDGSHAAARPSTIAIVGTVALVVVLILGIAVTGTLHGRGPYHGAYPWSSMPVLQAFIGILSILSITIGAVITERRAAGEALQESEHWLRESQRISRIGSYVLDVRTGDWTRSEILDEIFGVGPEYPHNLDAWTALARANGSGKRRPTRRPRTAHRIPHPTPQHHQA